MHFARVLRAAGLPVGPAKVIAALDAVDAVGIENREDFRAALAVGPDRAPRAADAVRSGLRAVLAQSAHARAHAAAAVAAGLRSRPARRSRGTAAGAARRSDVAAENASATRRCRRAGSRARCRVDLFAARSAAGQGFRVDEHRRAGAGQGHDRAPSPAVARNADAAHQGCRSRHDGRPARHACARWHRRAAPSCRWRGASAGGAARRWSCCATSPARWIATRACCSSSCTRSPTTAIACTCCCSARG